MRRMLVLSGMVLAGLLALASPAAAQNDAVICDGSATGVTVNGDVTVPEGGACELTNSTVRGNVKVRSGGFFHGSNTNVRGDVAAGHCASVVGAQRTGLSPYYFSSGL